jgi:Zn-dependent metalloprotease
MPNGRFIHGVSLFTLLAGGACATESAPDPRSGPQKLIPVDSVEDESFHAPSDLARSAAIYARHRTDHLAAGDEWQLRSAEIGADGRTHVRLDQMSSGIKVFGGDVVVHGDDTRFSALSGNVLGGAAAVEVAPLIEDKGAIILGKREYLEKVTDPSTPLAYDREAAELVILPGNADRDTRLAWHVTFHTEMQGGAPPGVWNGFYDARSGERLWWFNAIDTLSQASGPGGNPKVARTWVNALDVEPAGTQFQMNTARLVTTNMNNGTAGSGTIVVGPLNPISDAAIDDAHGFAENTLNMLRDWQGYNSIDNAGFIIRSRVHYSVNYENAFWDGSQMTYGDGATLFYPLSGSADVVAHEIDHGFTTFHSNLIYAQQSGGMNESFSDIAGEVAESYFKGTAPDFDVGRDIFRANSALRFMCNPTADGRSIDNFANYNDGLDVHFSSGIMNKAFCLTARRFGSGSPTGPATQASVLRASRAWYLANAHYWTAGSTFQQGCQGVFDAARALGYSATELAQIRQSWIEVGITCGSADELTIQRWATQQGGFWDAQKWVSGDFNGDGRTDMAKVFNDGGFASIDVHLSTGTGFVIQRWATRQGGFWDAQKWIAGDFNGDGKTDLANVFNDGGLADIDVHLSTGGSFGIARWATQQGGFWDAQQWVAGDFNGDGKTDLAKAFNDGGLADIDVHPSTGVSFGIARWATRQGGFWDAQKWMAGDFNGDGKADMAKVFNDNGLADIDVHPSTGASFGIQRWATQQGGFWDAQKWMAADFNGDGRCDVAKAFNDGGLADIDVHPSTGGSFGIERWATRQGGFWDAQQWVAGDWNGNGRRDLAKAFNDNGLADLDVHIH